MEQAAPVAMELSTKIRPSTSVILIVDDSRGVWLHGTPDLQFQKEIFRRPGTLYTGISTRNKADNIRNVFKQVVLSLSDPDKVGAPGLTSQLKPQNGTSVSRELQTNNA